MLKNLKVLAPFSILGTMVFVLVAVVMGVRYFDGTYDVDRSGMFVQVRASYDCRRMYCTDWVEASLSHARCLSSQQDLPDHYKPSFGTVGASGMWSPEMLVLVCMLFEAFVAHYNAPRFYTELKNHTIPRFRTVVT